MAREITALLADRHPLVITVMNGGLVFAGQLLPRLEFELDCSYVHVRRYGAGTQGGELVWIAGPQEPVKGRTVLLARRHPGRRTHARDDPAAIARTGRDRGADRGLCLEATRRSRGNHG